MKTCSIAYYVGNEKLGECELRLDDTYPFPISFAHFCPACGDIWGRTIVNAGTEWDTLRNYCEGHTDRALLLNPFSRTSPGSLLGYGRTAKMTSALNWSVVMDFMPRPVLEREFLLFVQYIERGHVPANQHY